MRLRNAASGHDSPSASDNNVTIPAGQDSSGGPPRKRIKLKFSNPSPALEPRPAPVRLFPRSKRQSAARVTIAEEAAPAEPASKPVKRSSLKIMSSSNPLVSSPSKSQNSPDLTDDDDAPSGYGNDFLANFIEDAPPSSSKDSDYASKPQSMPITLSSDLVPEGINTSSDDFTLTKPKAIFKKPRKVDNVETIIKKLQTACNALNALNISAGPAYQSLPSLPPQHGKSHDFSHMIRWTDYHLQSLVFRHCYSLRLGQVPQPRTLCQPASSAVWTKT